MSHRRKSKSGPAPLRTIDEDGVERTRIYEHVLIPDDDPWPRFTVLHPPRLPNQTDEQDRCSRKATERYHRSLGVMLGTSWLAATHLGYHRTCREKACRRMGRCAGRRHEEDWSTFPGACYPPCVDETTADEVRPISNELINILKEKMGPILARQSGRPRYEVMHMGLTQLPPGAMEEALRRVEKRKAELAEKLEYWQAE